MATLCSRRAGRVLAALLPTLAAFGNTGCVTTGLFHHSAAVEAAPTGVATQVVVLWNRNVTFAADPTKNGNLAPGIMGRLYLLGSDLKDPVAADGNVVVELYDDTPRGPNVPTNPNALERWLFDPPALAKLQKKDTIGWGYTLFLPWGTYRPDIGVVRLLVRYEPAKGTPLFAPAAPVTLDHGMAPNPTRMLGGPPQLMPQFQPQQQQAPMPQMLPPPQGLQQPVAQQRLTLQQVQAMQQQIQAQPPQPQAQFGQPVSLQRQ